MSVFSGNSSTSALSTAIGIPSKIKFFSIVNKSGGASVVNVSILYGSTNISIMPYNKSLAAGESYISDDEILLLPERQIYVLTNSNVDYYFVIE